MVAPICLPFRKLTTLYPFFSPTANSPSLLFDKTFIYGIHGIKTGARARDNISLIPERDASSISRPSRRCERPLPHIRKHRDQWAYTRSFAHIPPGFNEGRPGSGPCSQRNIQDTGNIGPSISRRAAKLASLRI
jgi:hypothetical protein